MTEDELILTHILQCSRSELYVHKPRLTGLQQEQFDSYKARRARGEPLQYILGVANFMGLDFKVDARVLIPRPETEVLVDLAIKQFKGKEILDIGTGSGCIAVTLAKHFPKVRVTAIDVSKDALELAKENAITHGVDGRIDFVHGDMIDYLTVRARHAVPLHFDLIISNPPYIPSADLMNLPADVKQEPQLALDGGDDGLSFYRAIIKMIPGLLREGGCLMMEFGDDQGMAIKNLISKPQIFSAIQIHKDLTGKDRIIYGKICD